MGYLSHSITANAMNERVCLAQRKGPKFGMVLELDTDLQQVKGVGLVNL